MNRGQWKSVYRDLRLMSAQDRDISRHSYGARGRGHFAARLMHGGTYWTVKYVRGGYGESSGLSCLPSIIRDRSTSSRIEDALTWARHFRLEAQKSYNAKGQKLAAARACIADARAIRLSGSIFHAIAA